MATSAVLTVKKLPRMVTRTIKPRTSNGIKTSRSIGASARLFCQVAENYTHIDENEDVRSMRTGTRDRGIKGTIDLLHIGALGMGASGAGGVVSELRMVSRPGDVNRDLGSGIVLLEESIRRLKQRSLPSADHLRNRRLHSCRPGKVESLALRSVGAVEMDVRAGHAVSNGGYREHAALQAEVALNMRGHIFACSGLQQVRHSLPAQAQLADALLHRSAGE